MEYPPSFIPRPGLIAKRDVKKVPFVELFDGRLQGVVSSGSDISRVYVTFLQAGTGNYSCSTNNNRPCGGLRGSPCKHLEELVKEAMAQFGAERVVEYLGANVEVTDKMKPWEVFQALPGTQAKENASVVFSRFLNYLRYCELKTGPGTHAEMNWFG